MISQKRSRKTAFEQDVRMLEAFEQYMSAHPLIVGGRVYQPREVLELLGQLASTSRAILEARAALTAAIKAEREKRAALAPFIRSFRMIVAGMFSGDARKLAAFGLRPARAPGPRRPRKSSAGS